MEKSQIDRKFIKLAFTVTILRKPIPFCKRMLYNRVTDQSEFVYEFLELSLFFKDFKAL